MNVNTMLVGNYVSDSPKLVSGEKEGGKTNSEFKDLVNRASSNQTQKNTGNVATDATDATESDDKKERFAEGTFEQEKSNLLEQFTLIHNMNALVPVVICSRDMDVETPISVESSTDFHQVVEKDGFQQQLSIVPEQLKETNTTAIFENEKKPLAEKLEQPILSNETKQDVEVLSKETKNNMPAKVETVAHQTVEKAKVPVTEEKIQATKVLTQPQEKKVVLKEEPVVALALDHVMEPEKEVVVIQVGENEKVPLGQNLAEKLGEKIIVSIKGENNEFHAILKPEGLGTIDVKMVSEGGKILVSLICNNENTKDLLHKNIASLARIVETNLGQAPVVTVSNEKESGWEQQQGSFDGHGKGQYQEQSEKNKNEENTAELDFVQRLRLGMLEKEEDRT